MVQIGFDRPAAAEVPVLGLLPLREYQQEALAAVNAGYDAGLRRMLEVMATGSGKTICFAHLIEQRRALGPALVLAHRDELIRQAADKIGMVDPGARIGIVKAEANQWRAPVVVGSVQTLQRANRLERIPPGTFRTIICDEAHHVAGAASYRRILEHLGALAEGTPILTVGYTATPVDGMGKVFEREVYRKGILDLIVEGYLCDVQARAIHLEADFDKLHTRHGDFIDSELDDLFAEANAPLAVVRAYKEHVPGKRTVVFTPSVASAYEMVGAFESAGIPAAGIDGEVPTEERQRVYRLFREGKIKVMANCAVLTEGFDEPSIEAIVIARPTRSKVLYQQMIGRGTRLYPGKDHVMILDVVGATIRHDLASVPAVLGLETKDFAKGGGSAVQAQKVALEGQRQRAIREGLQHDLTDAQRRLLSQEIDVFRRKAVWVTTGSKMVLSVGNGSWIALVPEGGGRETFNVVRQTRGEADAVIAAGMSLPYAQGVAEDHARRAAPALTDPTAKWRHAPPTEKQLQAAARLRIEGAGEMSKGELSDAMTLAIARLRDKDAVRKMYAAPAACRAECGARFRVLFDGLCERCYDRAVAS